MRDHFVGIVWELGSVTFTGLDVDGWPIAQHDGLGVAPKVGHYELHHPFGFMSRPRDPDTDKEGSPLPGKACNVLIGKIGNETHLFLCSDPRFVPNIPQLKKGGAAMYCAAGSFRVLDGENATETAYFPIPGTDKAHIVTTGIDGNGLPYIGLQHCDGMAIMMLDGSLTLKNNAGDAYVEVNAAGTTVNGALKVNGSLIAGDPVGAKPVAIAPELVTYLSGLEQAVSAAFAAIAPIGGGPAAKAAFDTASTALASAKAAIAAQKTSGA